VISAMLFLWEVILLVKQLRELWLLHKSLLGSSSPLSEYESMLNSTSTLIFDSHELARQLQAEEEQFARQEQERYIQRQREQAAYEQARRQTMEKDRVVKRKHKDCVLM